MKRAISLVSAAALALGSLLAMPTAAMAAPADFAEWPTCVTADDQYCVEVASLKLSDGTSTTLTAEGVRLEAYYFTVDPSKVIVVNLRAGTGQDLPEKLLGAALSFTLRTSTWQPSNSMSGQAGFVSYGTSKVGTNYTLSATATTIRYELNKDCNLDKKLCDGAADQVYKAFLQVNFAPANSPFDSAVLTTSGNREGSSWSANATRVTNLVQPKAAPFQIDAMLLNSELSQTLGSTSAFVAKNFKAVLTQNGLAVGTPTIVATSWGVLVTAKHATGGVMKLTVSPKTPLPRPVIQKVKVVNKSKQTVTVRSSKAAKVISVSCSTSSGAVRNFTSKSFTFTPTMPKGVWMCSASFVNGYRGPSSNVFMLSNAG